MRTIPMISSARRHGTSSQQMTHFAQQRTYCIRRLIELGYTERQAASEVEGHPYFVRAQQQKED